MVYNNLNYNLLFYATTRNISLEFNSCLASQDVLWQKKYSRGTAGYYQGKIALAWWLEGTDGHSAPGESCDAACIDNLCSALLLSTVHIHNKRPQTHITRMQCKYVNGVSNVQFIKGRYCTCDYSERVLRLISAWNCLLTTVNFNALHKYCCRSLYQKMLIECYH